MSFGLEDRKPRLTDPGKRKTGEKRYGVLEPRRWTDTPLEDPSDYEGEAHDAQTDESSTTV